MLVKFSEVNSVSKVGFDIYGIGFRRHFSRNCQQIYFAWLAARATKNIACQIKKSGACYLLAIVESTNGFAAIHKIFSVLIEFQSTTFSTEVAENLRVWRKFSSSSSAANKNVWKVFAAFPLSPSSLQRRNFKWINQLIYIKSDFAVCLQLGDELEWHAERLAECRKC